MSNLKAKIKKVNDNLTDEQKAKIKKAANKAADKIGDAVAKKVKGVDSEKVEAGINKYVDKYIK